MRILKMSVFAVHKNCGGCNGFVDSQPETNVGQKCEKRVLLGELFIDELSGVEDYRAN